MTILKENLSEVGRRILVHRGHDFPCKFLIGKFNQDWFEQDKNLAFPIACLQTISKT